MANVYSTEYSAAVITLPRGTVYGNLWDAKVRFQQFTLSTPSSPADGDVYHIAYLPPKAYVLMDMFFVQWAGQSSSPTMDVGWLAYTDTDDAAVVVDPNGLLDGLATVTAGFWKSGLHSISGTIGYSPPIVWQRDMDNRDEVTITLSLVDAAADASEAITGRVYYAVAG